MQVWKQRPVLNPLNKRWSWESLWALWWSLVMNPKIMCPSCVCLLSRFSCVLLFPTLWTIDHQALHLWNSPGKNTSGLSCLPPENLPNSGIEPLSFMSPALAGMFFASNTTWKVSWPSHPLKTLMNRLFLSNKLYQLGTMLMEKKLMLWFFQINTTNSEEKY